MHARALADAGETAEALAAYGKLAKAFPRDGTIQEEYVELLLTQSATRWLKLALAKARALEKKSPPQGPRWFRAKYAVALAHYRLGNKEQAAKIITLVELLHPELGGPELKAQFVALRARCWE